MGSSWTREKSLAPKPWSKSGIPAHNARMHLRKLRDLGVPQAVLASATGFSERCMASIMSGQTKYLKPATYDAIMAVGVSAVQGAERGKISSVHSNRLIDEILEVGYSKGWLARQLGLKINTFQISPTITIARALKIQAIHDRLWTANDTGQRVTCGRGKPIYGKPFRQVCNCYGVSDLQVKRKKAAEKQRRYRANQSQAC